MHLEGEESVVAHRTLGVCPGRVVALNFIAVGHRPIRSCTAKEGGLTRLVIPLQKLPVFALATLRVAGVHCNAPDGEGSERRNVHTLTVVQFVTRQTFGASCCDRSVCLGGGGVILTPCDRVVGFADLSHQEGNLHGWALEASVLGGSGVDLAAGDISVLGSALWSRVVLVRAAGAGGFGSVNITVQGSLCAASSICVLPVANITVGADQGGGG